MTDVLTGSYIPGESVFHKMNGTVKLFSFLVLLAAVVMTDTFSGYLLIMGAILVAAKVSKIQMKIIGAPVLRLWKFFLFIFCMNMVFFEGSHVLWSFWIFHISTEGMSQGAEVILRVIFAMALSGILMATTPPLQIISGVETLLSPLKWCRVPVSDVAMILGVAIQFIPTLLQETDIIKKAQTARGARFESTRLRDRAGSIAPLAVPVFVAAFRRADELAAAMEARGWRRQKGKLRERRAVLCRQDMAALAVSCILCTVQLFL